MKDILAGLIDGSMSLQEVEDKYDNIMESHDGGMLYDLLGISKAESTAFGHGLWFDELAEWRKNGWPNKCAICGKEIVIENWGWFAREINDGESHELVHIDCMDD